MRNSVRAQAIAERNRALHDSGAPRKEFSLSSLESRETADQAFVLPQSPAEPRLNGQFPRDVGRTNDVQRRYLDSSQVPRDTPPPLPAHYTHTPSVRPHQLYS